MEYLTAKGLITHRYYDGTVSITHAGVEEIEAALAQPVKPTQHLPAVTNITNIHNMINSQLQQGTAGSVQRQEMTQDDIREIREFIADFRKGLTELKLDHESEAEAQGELTTLEVQVMSPRPKAAIVWVSLKSLRTVLEGAAGNLIAAELLARLAGLP